MSAVIAELRKDLDERKAALVDEVLRLIREDAPKNKFSILAGRLRAIEDTEAKISQLMQEKRDS